MSPYCPIVTNNVPKDRQSKSKKRIKMNANNIRHLEALEKTKKIIKNVENGRSVGLSNDCSLFGLDIRVFKKHLGQYEELRNRLNSIDWIRIYKPTCYICNIVLDRKNYQNYNSIQKSKGFILSKKRYCDTCRKSRRKARFNNLKQRLKVLYIGAKRENKIRGINLDFDESFLHNLYRKQKGKCYYSGIKMSFNSGNKYKMSIDRIDSQMPYSKNNIVLSCWVINEMKKNLPSGEFITLCKKVATQTKNK